MKEEVIRGCYSNGQLSYENPYKNGKLHGLKKDWYENGQLSSETLYRNGNVYGLLKSWWKSGECAYETPLKKDLQCGAKISFYY